MLRRQEPIPIIADTEAGLVRLEVVGEEDGLQDVWDEAVEEEVEPALSVVLREKHPASFVGKVLVVFHDRFVPVVRPQESPD